MTRENEGSEVYLGTKDLISLGGITLTVCTVICSAAFYLSARITAVEVKVESIDRRIERMERPGPRPSRAHLDQIDAIIP